MLLQDSLWPSILHSKNACMIGTAWCSPPAACLQAVKAECVSTPGLCHDALLCVVLLMATESELEVYKAKDRLVLYTLRPGASELAGLGTTLTRPPATGSIRFEQDKYDTFVRAKTAGHHGWELRKATVKL